jgi:cytochrome c2
MNQVRYIVYTVLLLLLFFIVYLVFLQFPKDKLSKKPPIVLNQPHKVDSLPSNMIMAKKLFEDKCAACHGIYKTDNHLAGFEERWPDKKDLFDYIRNPKEVIKRNSYAKKLKETYGVEPLGFPELTDEEIQSIINYINWVSNYH